MLTAAATALAGGAASPPPLPGFLAALAGPLEQYGLWAIFVLVLLEDFGIPVPGETVLIAGAVYAGSGRLNIVAVGVVGFVAAPPRARCSTQYYSAVSTRAFHSASASGRAVSSTCHGRAP